MAHLGAERGQYSAISGDRHSRATYNKDQKRLAFALDLLYYCFSLFVILSREPFWENRETTKQKEQVQHRG